MGVIKEEHDYLGQVLRRYQATGTTDAVLAEVEGGWAAALGLGWSPVSSDLCPAAGGWWRSARSPMPAPIDGPRTTAASAAATARRSSASDTRAVGPADVSGWSPTARSSWSRSARRSGR